MFGIGFSELVLIALAVILFVRPADLPKFFREAGKAWAYIKKGLAEANAVKDAFIKQVDEIAKLEDAPADKGLISADAGAGPGERTIEAETAIVDGGSAGSGAPEGSHAGQTQGGVPPSAVAPDASPKAAAPAKTELEPRVGPKPLASFDASDPDSGRGYEEKPKP